MSWLELSVEAPRDAVESVAELFHRIGHGGVAVEESIVPRVEGDGYDLDLARPISVRTYVPADATASDRVRDAEAGLWHLGRIVPIGELVVRAVAEEDWAENWKAHYQVLHLGKRTVIKPSWRDYTPAAGEIVVELDPGMAFGTGLHASTRSCLVAAERLLDTVSPARVLDLGTGSGILAIAAVRLGARGVVARDIDPVAVAAAQANVERNGLAAVITAEQGSLIAGESYDFIFANLIASILIDLAEQLRAALQPGAPLIASGIIDQRLDEVVAAFAAAGLRIDEVIADGDWRTLICF